MKILSFFESTHLTKFSYWIICKNGEKREKFYWIFHLFSRSLQSNSPPPLHQGRISLQVSDLKSALDPEKPLPKPKIILDMKQEHLQYLTCAKVMHIFFYTHIRLTSTDKGLVPLWWYSSQQFLFPALVFNFVKWALEHINISWPWSKTSLNIESWICHLGQDILFIFSVTRRSRSDESQWVSNWVTEWVSVSIDFTDVTLVSDDTYRRLYWCDPDYSHDPDESYLVMKVI